MATFDLKAFSDILPQDYFKLKSQIKKLVSGIAIEQDLKRASSYLSELIVFHHNSGYQSLQDMPEEMKTITHALFAAGLSSFCRAAGEASNTRNKIDFSSAFNKAGLSESADRIDKYRNTELAHYAGFIGPAGRHSLELAILVTDDSNQDTYISQMFRHVGVDRVLFDDAIKLIDIAFEKLVTHQRDVRKYILQAISSDKELRRLLLSSDDCRIDVSKHAPPGANLKPFEPIAPVFMIDWTS